MHVLCSWRSLELKLPNKQKSKDRIKLAHFLLHNNHLVKAMHGPGEPLVCTLQGKWRSTDRWKPTCRMKTRIQKLKWLERLLKIKKNVLCTYLFKSRRTAPGADYRLLTAPRKGWDFDFTSFHTPKNSQPNGWLEVGKTSNQVCITSGSSFIDLRRLLSMFWHPKIDNEQSRVLGGGWCGLRSRRQRPWDRVTVWKRKC